jgi:hypothetical protein
LICTRGRLTATSITKQLRGNIFGGHPLAKFGNSLEVPVAATGKADVADFVAIAGELDCGGTCAPGPENFFHKNLLDNPFYTNVELFYTQLSKHSSFLLLDLFVTTPEPNSNERHTSISIKAQKCHNGLCHIMGYAVSSASSYRFSRSGFF